MEYGSMSRGIQPGLWLDIEYANIVVKIVPVGAATVIVGIEQFARFPSWTPTCTSCFPWHVCCKDLDFLYTYPHFIHRLKFFLGSILRPITFFKKVL